MKTLKILSVIALVIFSGFSRDSQMTEAGVTVPMKFDGVIILNLSSELTVCTPVGDQYPEIGQFRTGWLEGNQTHGGKLITEQSTWEIFNCNTDFATMLITSQIVGVCTVANGDSYSYTCTMVTNFVSKAVTLYVTATGGTGRFEGVTGQMTLTGFHSENGIPVSGEGFLSFPK